MLPRLLVLLMLPRLLRLLMVLEGHRWVAVVAVVVGAAVGSTENGQPTPFFCMVCGRRRNR